MLALACTLLPLAFSAQHACSARGGGARTAISRGRPLVCDEESVLPHGYELALARDAVSATGELLLELQAIDPERACRHATQHLEFVLSTEVRARMPNELAGCGLWIMRIVHERGPRLHRVESSRTSTQLRRRKRTCASIFGCVESRVLYMD